MTRADHSYNTAVEEAIDLIHAGANPEAIRNALLQQVRDAALWPDEIDHVIRDANERAQKQAIV